MSIIKGSVIALEQANDSAQEDLTVAFDRMIREEQ
jgi:hypothetical protein